MLDQISTVCESGDIIVVAAYDALTTRCNAGELESHPIEILAHDSLRTDRFSGTLVQGQRDLFARAPTGASMLRERSTLSEAAVAARSKGKPLARFNLLSRQS
jgi:hypothetical protein